MAWGKPWPRHSGKIHKTEFTHDNYAGYDDYTGSVDDEDALSEEPHVARPVFNHVDRFFADILEVPSVFEYTCFTDIKRLKYGLGLRNAKDDALVVRGDYDILRKALEEGCLKDKDCVVTGHHGIGSYER